jgi:hypothetical protein
MGKKLAIRGHLMRGKEVIKLLEMMGGKNIHKPKYDGSANMYSYYIINDTILNDRLSIIEDDDFIIFTLEEFLEKYPFKVGDVVFDVADGDIGTIAVMKWDEDVSDMKYRVDFNNGDIGWFTNDTIYFYLNKDNKEMNGNIETNHSKVNGLKRGDEYPIMEGVECNECIKYYFPDGYEFVDTDDTGVYLKPIKSKYPKTYEECCDKINFKGGFKQMLLSDDEYSLYISLIKLKRCRNAYWKIAGEQMGLGKPWEPDFTDTKEMYYIFYKGYIEKGNQRHPDNHILIFPTPEMRDTFYKNFKGLIEECKELL